MLPRIILRDVNGGNFDITQILSFVFKKDIYMPYTSLSAVFKALPFEADNISEILFYADEKCIHHGIADVIDFYSEYGENFCKISSRGFTSLLCLNQIEPGIKTNISFNSLMDSFYTLPYVTHEDNSDTSNYIYVKSGSNMWEGVANLGYKLYGFYPFIRDTNTVRITPVPQPNSFEYPDSMLLKRGKKRDTRRMKSHYHMADFDGVYGIYELSDSYVCDLNIVRHSFFDLDKQFLYSPQDALVYRDRFNCRQSLAHYCLYSGYNFEDLTDLISFGTISNKKISSVKIVGNNNGIFTEIAVYSDYFNRD